LGLDINEEKEIDYMNDLINPLSPVCKGILFMYSMETFLPYNLNAAERIKDASKV
jgi:hypothetical protein